MSQTLWTRSTLLAAVLGVSTAWLGDSRSQELAPPIPVEGNLEIVAHAEEAPQASPYWIGVQLEPLPEVLKAHLNLEAGMVAVHVFEKSPAEKAGLKPHDVLLKAGEGYIKEPGDLVRFVGDAKDSELELVIVRSGKEQTVKVVPVKRPMEEGLRVTEAVPEKNALGLQHALEEYSLHLTREQPYPQAAFIRVAPGFILREQVKMDLPKDVSVCITKEGDQPARIEVKKGDSSWVTTPDDLPRLPEEVQGYVRQALRAQGGAMDWKQAIRYRPTVARLPANAVTNVPVPSPAIVGGEGAKTHVYVQEIQRTSPDGGGVIAKLDKILQILDSKEDSEIAALQKQLQELQKKVDELSTEKK